ncbi:MAG: Hsp20/alpha crystallin family protein [Candidatus Scalindua rubra]|uniref:First small heat shock protein n=1 Tax=Candidatus Scalindua brodae TaxID=237368 RepID=A0A0B0EN89_9BACT|nr:MAG: first small heat shock protein [Candidatus Scalindua brodae]MBZ0109406.1 Hsp20/alpha crystallin family protein [Candidatus Scalindua rubra]TWU34806.1 Spore protein SP21 [Candidatus Brocadiaceae bacterium S225]
MDKKISEVKKVKDQEVKKSEFTGEKTVAGKYYVPLTDIVETEKSLVVTMDIPGVKKENIHVKLEDNVLEVDGQIDYSTYNDLNPVYTEYNVGHFTRKFSVSNEIDTGNIDANLSDGVLTLTLPKAPEAQPRQIKVN